LDVSRQPLSAQRPGLSLGILVAPATREHEAAMVNSLNPRRSTRKSAQNERISAAQYSTTFLRLAAAPVGLLSLFGRLRQKQTDIFETCVRRTDLCAEQIAACERAVTLRVEEPNCLGNLSLALGNRRLRRAACKRSWLDTLLCAKAVDEHVDEA
jgi:hypothetical protein